MNRGRQIRLVVLSSLTAVQLSLDAQPVPRFAGPTSSQPLALSANGDFLVAANPDNNSVSFFDVRGGATKRAAIVPVQVEPNGVAFSPDGGRAWVANTVSGTVSVIRTNIANGSISKPHKHIRVGTEPYGLVLAPNGTRLYVANARSNTVSVIDTATETVVATIFNVPKEPRGLAMTNDGDADDADETLYVTSFLSALRAGKVDGADDAKVGVVTVISTAANAVTNNVVINPIADTGFNATGDALARIAPGDPGNPANFLFPTGAYPNQFNNIAIHRTFAYLPNTGASPNGPVRFDVNTQSLLSRFDTTTGLDAGTINMHQAVKAQTGVPKLFITQPWAMAFKHGSDEAYVVSAASNIVVKVETDPVTGAPAVVNDPLDLTRVLQVPVGRNPRGIVVNASDTRAYVMNYISRDVSVIDLTGPKETVVATMPSVAMPAPGTLADRVHIGKELYNTSVGVFDAATAGGAPITGRMSNNGWGSCAACHTPFGLSDNVVWIFAAGPRRTIPQHADFDPSDQNRAAMRMLNWSANRDEQEDFELNIRGVSGGQGIIVQGDGVTPDPAVVDLIPTASANRNQLKVRGVGGWDALKAFVQFGIRAPISPASKTDPEVLAGRALFTAANCQQCHGSAQWTTSRVRFAPPPAPAQVVNGQIVSELLNVGTFDPAFFNEVRANAAVPLGAAGFVPPSLLSVFAFEPPLLHNGGAPSLNDVLNNVTHRSAGTGGVDTLSNPSDRSFIVAFLRSIDAATVPIN